MRADNQTSFLENILTSLESYRWPKDTDKEWERFCDLVLSKQSQRDFDHILFQENSADTLWNLSLKHIDKKLLTPDNPTLAMDLLYSVPPQRMADYKLLTLMHSGQIADIFSQEAHKQGYPSLLAVGINQENPNPSLKQNPGQGGRIFSLLKTENSLLLLDPFEMVRQKEVRAGMINMPVFQLKSDQIPYPQVLDTTVSGFKIVRLWQNAYQQIPSFKEWQGFQKNYQESQNHPNEYQRKVRSQTPIRERQIQLT